MSHYQQNGSPVGSGSDSEDSVKGASTRRYGSLKAKQVALAKAHSARRYFDSAEWACGLQGVVLQDVLPGGAPVDTRPVKSEPTPRAQRGRSMLTVEAPRHLQAAAAYTKQISTCDY